MNDPNGPIYYKGYYHLFYQYTPTPQSGLKYWGHAVSKDMAFWQILPIALSPDRPYDNNGIFSGSAVILDDGTPMLVYTGQTNVEQQCVALPNNTNDPLLQDWWKPNYNPIIPRPPAEGDPNNFRDPATPFKLGSTWYLVTGCTYRNSGSALLWASSDLKTWSFSDIIYTNNNFGTVWECPDFFQAPDSPSNHVFKLSGNGQDWWAVGTLNTNSKTWSPLPGAAFVLCDAGHYYASKNFHDPVKNRQINWGWVSEEDNGGPSRGWQGLMSFPVKVTIDPAFKIPVVTPIEELSLLKGSQLVTGNHTISPNGDYVLPVYGNQYMINATFNVPQGATLGIKVLQSSSVYTSIVYQRVSSSQGNLYVDRTNSGSTGSRNRQSGTFPVQDSENTINICVLVDHSVVEVFEGRGRTKITSRLYTPQDATGSSLFTSVGTTVNIDSWLINSIWK